MTLAIYCAGGLGKEVLEFARSISRWDEILFVDDVTNATECHGARVLRFTDIAALGNDVEFVIASGEPDGRKTLYEKIKADGYSMTTLISPYALVSPGAQVGEGSIIFDCSISIDVTVQENVFINTRAVIGHDTVIGQHTVISNNCFVGGHSVIGNSVYMAPGAMMKDRITVGDCAIISLGAVLLRNVRSGTIMVGNPARHLGDNEKKSVFNMFDK